jgi:hypothetical protein
MPSHGSCRRSWGATFAAAGFASLPRIVHLELTTEYVGSPHFKINRGFLLVIVLSWFTLVN